mgnify:CR=1 FL=1
MLIQIPACILSRFGEEMDLINVLPVIFVLGSFVACFGYLAREFVLSRWF